MNKDKVYLKGYVIGRAVDTLGYEGLMVQLENLDVVEIDKNHVHRDIDEPQKVMIPRFIADWIVQAKEDGYNIAGAINEAPRGAVDDWLELENVDIFAEAWVNGYHIEKEKRYRVSLKNGQPLLKAYSGEALYFSQDIAIENYKVTRKELENAGYGWVFDCEGMEVKEVKE